MAIEIETENARVKQEYLVRVQIPSNEVKAVLKAITKVCQLKYGNYEQVAFRYNSGTQQFKPLENSKSGATELILVACDELSFTVPKEEYLIKQVIEAIFESHPYEEPVILIGEVISTRFKYSMTRDNPNKWWNRSDLDWVPKNQREQTASKQVTPGGVKLPLSLLSTTHKGAL